MNEELEALLKEIKEYRNDMVARNYPYQRISDIITRWEMREFVPVTVAPSRKLDFLEEAEKEKQELDESYKESVRQAKERKHFHAKAIDGYGE
jgi:predicted patatin/cPLA2 family phospholipase